MRALFKKGLIWVHLVARRGGAFPRVKGFPHPCTGYRVLSSVLNI